MVDCFHHDCCSGLFITDGSHVSSGVTKAFNYECYFHIWMLFVNLNVVCISECCLYIPIWMLYTRIRGSLARVRPTALGCIGDTNGPLPRYTRLSNMQIYILHTLNIYIYTCRIYIQPRILYKCLETTNCASSLLLLQHNAMNTKGHSCDVSSCISDQKNHLQQNCLYVFVNSW